MEDKKEKATKGGARWQEVVIGGVTGIALGAASTLLMGSASAKESIPEENTEPTESEAQEPVDNGYAPMASNVNDNMSFNEAFAAARAEVGPGGVFEWHGGLYGTYYASEWNAMDDAARNEYYNTVPWHSASHHHTANNTTSTTETHHTETVVDDGGRVDEHGETNDGGNGGGGENADADIEIIGVEHANLDGEHDSIIGAASVDGQAVYFVDIDGTDDQFDVMIADLNGNSEIEENEVFDITDQNMSVSHFEQLANASGNGGGEDNLDEMYANNDTLPDYVNDVDPGNIE